MAIGFATKAIRLESGERFPLVTDKASGVPCPWACRYSLAHHRTLSINSAKSQADSICLLYDWARKNSIDLDQRIGSGNLFSAHEAEMLVDALRISRKATRIANGKEVARVVHADTHADYVRDVSNFIKWRISHVTTAMPVTDARVPAINSRLQALREQLKSLTGSGSQSQRKGLTEEQQLFFLKVIHPDHELNPFHPETRHRNYALLLFLFELGTRRAEPLVLKGRHVQLEGASPRIIIEPRADDPDETRADPPLVKTAGRTLMVSKPLGGALNTYITKHRPKLRLAKKQIFIFLESVNGTPMTLGAVDDLLVVLRRRFPDQLPGDFSPHILRHTWNDRFTAAIKTADVDPEFAEVLRRYLMGWAKNSKQASNYSRREIERQSAVLMLALQDQMEGLMQ
jgi:integrase